MKSEELKTFRVGNTIKQDTISSWTKTKSGLQDEYDVLLEFESNKSVFDVGDLSKNPGEIFVEQGQKMEISSVKKIKRKNKPTLYKIGLKEPK